MCHCLYSWQRRGPICNFKTTLECSVSAELQGPEFGFRPQILNPEPQCNFKLLTA